jgi:hypothetical protein
MYLVRSEELPSGKARSELGGELRPATAAKLEAVTDCLFT